MRAEARFSDVRHFRSACEHIRREVEAAAVLSDALRQMLPRLDIWEVRRPDGDYSIYFNALAVAAFPDLVALVEAKPTDDGSVSLDAEAGDRSLVQSSLAVGSAA